MKKLLSSFSYAFKGLKYAFATQQNFRIHMAFTLFAIAMGLFLQISCAEWLWISLCITIVLLTELLNTALETLTDVVSPGYHKLAGHIKDISAAAVLITAFFALFTGFTIFLPKLLLLIKHAA